MLNRDVWSNATIKEIIKDRFIFWQINSEKDESRRYIHLYNVHEYPHVSILDPRTGVKLCTFSGRNLDPLADLTEFIIDFINEFPTPNGQLSNFRSNLPSPICQYRS